MKFTIQQSTFLAALGNARLFTVGRGAPAISCVRVSSGGDGIVLFASDGGESITASVDAEVTKPGALLLPCGKLIDAVKAMSGDIAVAAIKPHGAQVSCVGTTAKIYGLDPAEGMHPPLEEDSESVTLAGLNEKLGRARAAICQDASRWALCGVALQSGGGRLEGIATDGNRLLRLEFGDCAHEFNAIIPEKAVALIASVVGDDECELRVSKSMIWVKSARIEIASRLVDANSPNFQQVCPAPLDTKIKCEREQLIEAVKAILQFADSGPGISRSMKFESKKTGIVVSGMSLNSGSIERTIECQPGLDAVFGCNPAFLLDALKASRSDEVEIEVGGDELAPIAIRGDGFLSVLMPMRISY